MTPCPPDAQPFARRSSLPSSRSPRPRAARPRRRGVRHDGPRSGRRAGPVQSGLGAVEAVRERVPLFDTFGIRNPDMIGQASFFTRRSPPTAAGASPSRPAGATARAAASTATPGPGTWPRTAPSPSSARTARRSPRSSWPRCRDRPRTAPVSPAARPAARPVPSSSPATRPVPAGWSRARRWSSVARTAPRSPASRRTARACSGSRCSPGDYTLEAGPVEGYMSAPGPAPFTGHRRRGDLAGRPVRHGDPLSDPPLQPATGSAGPRSPRRCTRPGTRPGPT